MTFTGPRPAWRGCRGWSCGCGARELQILQTLADGCSPAEVAERLVISPKTVRNHLTNVYEKLDVGSRSQAIVVALQYGLIELA